MPPETACWRSGVRHSSLHKAGLCTCRENVFLVHCKPLLRVTLMGGAERARGGGQKEGSRGGVHPRPAMTSGSVMGCEESLAWK